MSANRIHAYCEEQIKNESMRQVYANVSVSAKADSAHALLLVDLDDPNAVREAVEALKSADVDPWFGYDDNEIAEYKAARSEFADAVLNLI